MTVRLVHPPLWLGQSVRTTLVVRRYPALADLPFMASLGDAIHRPQLIDRVFSHALRVRLRVTGPLMLDSGGFTLMTQGPGKLDAAMVGRIYSTCGADLVLALDEPASLRDELGERRRKHAVTLANLSVLARLVDPEKLVPVIHGPELADVARNAEACARIFPRPRVVAIGGLVPTLRVLREASRCGQTASDAGDHNDQGSISRERDPRSRGRRTSNNASRVCVRCRLSRFHRMA